MTSLLLHEFVPDGAPKPEPQGETLDQQIARAWAEGHAAGVQEGAEASAAEHAESQDALRAELIEVLRDQRMSRHEVQASVLTGAAPAVLAVVRRLTPRLAAAGLAEHVASALEDALRARPDPAPVIRCAAESVRGLEQALSGWSGRFTIEADPRLTPLEVELHWQDGFDAIDMDGLTAAIDAALEAALTPPNDESTQEERANV